MADLELFASDVQAIREGAWETPGHEWDDMELKVRGFGPHYTEPLAKAQKEAVRKARSMGDLKPGQEWDDLPLTMRNQINDAMMLKHTFIDVRNLRLRGEPVTAEKYREYAMMPQFRDHLMGALYMAAQIVTSRRQDTKERAEGNSPAFFDTNSIGDDSKSS